MVVHSYNPSSVKPEAGGPPHIQGQPGLHIISDFQARLNYMVGHCLKNTQKKFFSRISHKAGHDSCSTELLHFISYNVKYKCKCKFISKTFSQKKTNENINRTKSKTSIMGLIAKVDIQKVVNYLFSYKLLVSTKLLPGIML